MELTCNHVGRRGAVENCRKMVFGRVALERIEGSIPLPCVPRSLPPRGRGSWRAGATSGVVPVGERISIVNLTIGDAVLLVESVAGQGWVQALWPDVLYRNRAYHDLSGELRGNAKHPYIF